MYQLTCPHCNESSGYIVEDEKIINCTHCKKEFLCWYDYKAEKFVASAGGELWYVKHPNRNIYISGDQ